MRTKELIDRMPKQVNSYLDKIRTQYKNDVISYDEMRYKISAYTTALRDIGFITDRERGTLYNYYTL